MVSHILVSGRFARIAVGVAVTALLLDASARGQEQIVRASVADDGHESKFGGHAGTRFGAVSGDGRHVAFISESTDLVAGDDNGLPDVFVRDLQDGTTARCSVSSAGDQSDTWILSAPVISQNGRFVAFSSDATKLVPGDQNLAEDIFVHDRDPDGNGILDEGNGTTERVSVASDGAEANGGSIEPSISADGDVVAFRSSATNLIAVDLNGKFDVFVHTRSTGITQRASRSATAGANDDCVMPQISGDGTAVVFISRATNLDGGGVNTYDVFVRDLALDVIQLVSSDANGVPATHNSDNPSISGDGRYVTFRSESANLFPEGHGGNTTDLFLKDRTTGAIDCITVDSSGLAGLGGVFASISSDATSVAFSSTSNQFVPNDTNGSVDVFVRDLASKSYVCASVNRAGVPTAGGAEYNVSLSQDGRYAVFVSISSELVADDTNGHFDVFMHDLDHPGFQASWSNYGAGWPGTHGVPTLVLDRDPEFGATITAQASNSWGFYAVGFLLIGFAQQSLVTNLGGTLLVDADQLVPVIIAPSGWSASTVVPYDPALSGLELDLQMLEVDPGATKGVSFSPGLQLVFGL